MYIRKNNNLFNILTEMEIQLMSSVFVCSFYKWRKKVEMILITVLFI